MPDEKIIEETPVLLDRKGTLLTTAITGSAGSDTAAGYIHYYFMRLR